MNFGQLVENKDFKIISNEIVSDTEIKVIFKVNENEEYAVFDIEGIFYFCKYVKCMQDKLSKFTT